ncbi:MAG: hypothetical protein E6K92_07850 [Thaumarchaeota archaeon]|nr:MAG: hypothetical protein E6K92_07850 [Nitrososphaerota archaeon]
MVRDALIDEDIRGWFINDNRAHLEAYGATYTAGKNGDLPWLDSDDKIATFCKENNCDLFTSDKKSYTNYFDAKIQTIQITKYAFWRDGKRPIFMIRIIS